MEALFSGLSASTLRERAEALRPGVEKDEWDDPCDDFLWEAWRAGRELERDDVWGARLASLDSNDFDILRCIRMGHRDFRPTRAQSRIESFVEDLLTTARRCDGVFSRIGAAHQPMRLPLFLPLHVMAKDALLDRVGRSPREIAATFEIESVLTSMLSTLSQRIQDVCGACVERDHREMVQGENANETDSLRSFAPRRTGRPGDLDELLRRYPVLARFLSCIFENWVSSTAEMIIRTIEDRSLIARHLRIPREDRVRSVEGPWGDHHYGGRAVHCLRFEGGGKILYKPRPVVGLVVYRRLRELMFDEGLGDAYLLPEVIDRGEYGWMEFVETSSCTCEEDVSTFYRRQGVNLAILYFLGGRDILHENVIARGAIPNLVDLECILTPEPFEVDSPGDGPAVHVFRRSVMNTGMLAMRSIAGPDRAGPFVSGLTATGSGPDPHEGDGGSYPRLGVEDVALEPGNEHLPRLDGRLPAPEDFIEDLVTGFGEGYGFFLAHRAHLLSRDFLDRLRDIPVRILMRSTSVYARVLREMTHPECLTSVVECDRVLDSYWNAYDSDAFPGSVIETEIHQCWGLDVPCFGTRSDSTDLWFEGDKIEEGFFEKSGLESYLDRVAGASVEDMNLQVSLIERSFEACRDRAAISTTRTHGLDVSRDSDVASDRELVKAAEAIGDRIRAMAFHDGEHLGWIDFGVGQTGEWELLPKSSGLYDGTEGLALFYGYLSDMSGRPEFGSIAETLTRQAWRQFRDIAPATRRTVSRGRISPLMFPLSVAYLHEHVTAIGRSVAEPSEVRRRAYEWIEDELEHDQAFDVIQGAAGAIAYLLDVFERHQEERASDLARRCGDHLARAARRGRRGASWAGPVFKDIGGFAHGAAGISWALLWLGSVTGREEYIDLGKEALSYDRSLFDDRLCAWRDARRSVPAWDVAWCHGSSGIGLARCLSLPYLDDPLLELEMDLAASHIRSKGLGSNHCLCHGELGNLEILAILSRALGAHEVVDAIGAHLHTVLNSSDNGPPWKCGAVERDVDFTGLFMGLSGVGYAFLRFADPNVLPSILCLRGPASGNVR